MHFVQSVRRPIEVAASASAMQQAVLGRAMTSVGIVGAAAVESCIGSTASSVRRIKELDEVALSAVVTTFSSAGNSHRNKRLDSDGIPGDLLEEIQTAGWQLSFLKEEGGPLQCGENKIADLVEDVAEGFVEETSAASDPLDHEQHGSKFQEEGDAQIDKSFSSIAGEAALKGDCTSIEGGKEIEESLVTTTKPYEPARHHRETELLIVQGTPPFELKDVRAPAVADSCRRHGGGEASVVRRHCECTETAPSALLLPPRPPNVVGNATMPLKAVLSLATTAASSSCASLDSGDGCAVNSTTETANALSLPPSNSSDGKVSLEDPHTIELKDGSRSGDDHAITAGPSDTAQRQTYAEDVKASLAISLCVSELEECPFAGTAQHMVDPAGGEGASCSSAVSPEIGDPTMGSEKEEATTPTVNTVPCSLLLLHSVNRTTRNDSDGSGSTTTAATADYSSSAGGCQAAERSDMPRTLEGHCEHNSQQELHHGPSGDEVGLQKTEVHVSGSSMTETHVGSATPLSGRGLMSGSPLGKCFTGTTSGMMISPADFLLLSTSPTPSSTVAMTGSISALSNSTAVERSGNKIRSSLLGGKVNCEIRSEAVVAPQNEIVWLETGRGNDQQKDTFEGALKTMPVSCRTHDRAGHSADGLSSNSAGFDHNRNADHQPTPQQVITKGSEFIASKSCPSAHRVFLSTNSAQSDAATFNTLNLLLTPPRKRAINLFPLNEGPSHSKKSPLPTLDSEGQCSSSEFLKFSPTVQNGDDIERVMTDDISSADLSDLARFMLEERRLNEQFHQQFAPSLDERYVDPFLFVSRLQSDLHSYASNTYSATRPLTDPVIDDQYLPSKNNCYHCSDKSLSTSQLFDEKCCHQNQQHRRIADMDSLGISSAFGTPDPSASRNEGACLTSISTDMELASSSVPQFIQEIFSSDRLPTAATAADTSAYAQSGFSIQGVRDEGKRLPSSALPHSTGACDSSPSEFPDGAAMSPSGVMTVPPDSFSTFDFPGLQRCQTPRLFTPTLPSPNGQPPADMNDGSSSVSHPSQRISNSSADMHHFHHINSLSAPPHRAFRVPSASEISSTQRDLSPFTRQQQQRHQNAVDPDCPLIPTSLPRASLPLQQMPSDIPNCCCSATRFGDKTAGQPKLTKDMTKVERTNLMSSIAFPCDSTVSRDSTPQGDSGPLTVSGTGDASSYGYGLPSESTSHNLQTFSEWYDCQRRDSLRLMNECTSCNVEAKDANGFCGGNDDGQGNTSSTTTAAAPADIDSIDGGVNAVQKYDIDLKCYENDNSISTTCDGFQTSHSSLKFVWDSLRRAREQDNVTEASEMSDKRNFDMQALPNATTYSFDCAALRAYGGTTSGDEQGRMSTCSLSASRAASFIDRTGSAENRSEGNLDGRDGAAGGHGLMENGLTREALMGQAGGASVVDRGSPLDMLGPTEEPSSSGNRVCVDLPCTPFRDYTLRLQTSDVHQQHDRSHGGQTHHQQQDWGSPTTPQSISSLAREMMFSDLNVESFRAAFGDQLGSIFGDDGAGDYYEAMSKFDVPVVEFSDHVSDTLQDGGDAHTNRGASALGCLHNSTDISAAVDYISGAHATSNIPLLNSEQSNTSDQYNPDASKPHWSFDMLVQGLQQQQMQQDQLQQDQLQHASNFSCNGSRLLQHPTPHSSSTLDLSPHTTDSNRHGLCPSVNPTKAPRTAGHPKPPMPFGGAPVPPPPPLDHDMIPQQSTSSRGGHLIAAAAAAAAAQASSSLMFKSNNVGRRGSSFGPLQSASMSAIKNTAPPPPHSWRPESSTNLDPGDFVGRVVNLAKMQSGSRCLQRELWKGNREVISVILKEISADVTNLMVDPYGNYLCQELFQACSREQRRGLLECLAPKAVRISCDRRGTHSMQALISLLKSPEEERLLISHMVERIVELSVHPHGTHVIQHALTCFGEPTTSWIMEPIVQNVHDVAESQHGLCVVKKCISIVDRNAATNSSASSSHFEELLEKINLHAARLIPSPYGNYAVQHAMDTWGAERCKRIIMQIKSKLIPLSTQKFSSNVVEKCIKMSNAEDLRDILAEICEQKNMSTLIASSYGNFVVQQALERAQPAEALRVLQSVREGFHQCRNKRQRVTWERICAYAEARSRAQSILPFFHNRKEGKVTRTGSEGHTPSIESSNSQNSSSRSTYNKGGELGFQRHSSNGSGQLLCRGAVRGAGPRGYRPIFRDDRMSSPAVLLSSASLASSSSSQQHPSSVGRSASHGLVMDEKENGRKVERGFQPQPLSDGSSGTDCGSSRCGQSSYTNGHHMLDSIEGGDSICQRPAARTSDSGGGCCSSMPNSVKDDSCCCSSIGGRGERQRCATERRSDGQPKGSLIGSGRTVRGAGDYGNATAPHQHHNQRKVDGGLSDRKSRQHQQQFESIKSSASLRNVTPPPEFPRNTARRQKAGAMEHRTTTTRPSNGMARGSRSDFSNGNNGASPISSVSMTRSTKSWHEDARFRGEKRGLGLKAPAFTSPSQGAS